MELEDWVLDIIVCPKCRAALARRGRRERAGMHRVRARLPGPRQHPGAADRRSPQALNTPPGGAALAAFRLDDTEIVEAAIQAGCCARSPRRPRRSARRCARCAEADLSALSQDNRPRAIVVAGSGGAGGSTFACDALAAICGLGSPVQVTGVSGYQLPGWVGAADLVITVSRSGHTAEALALAGEAARRGCDLLGVSAPDSALQELVAQARGTFIPVTPVGPARAMPWALTVPLLVAAARLGVARIDDTAYEAAAERHGGRLAPVPPVERVVRQPGQVPRARPGGAATADLGRLAGRGGGRQAVRLAARGERQVPGGGRAAARGRARPGGGVRRPVRAAA